MIETPLLRFDGRSRQALGGTALVALQHLLPSLVPLFERFVDAGFGASGIFLTGKPYSTVAHVVAKLRECGLRVSAYEQPGFAIGHFGTWFSEHIEAFWAEVMRELPAGTRRVVILDEGGWLCQFVPSKLRKRCAVVAVEHTMSGLFQTPEGGHSFPRVLMAASAAKSKFENVVIADAILERLGEAVNLSHQRVGIIGLGNLGQAVARGLQTQPVKGLAGYDVSPERHFEVPFVDRTRRLADLILECDVLLGCTGRDTLEPGAALSHAPGPRCLASCSSGDIEFRRVALLLARHSTGSDPFSDSRGRFGQVDVLLLNGGFPINFDRESEREHPARIQLTRELTFASVMQAALCVDPEQDAADLMLDPVIQGQLVQRWLKNDSISSLFPTWYEHDVEWWTRHSRGVPASSPLFEWLNVEA